MQQRYEQFPQELLHDTIFSRKNNYEKKVKGCCWFIHRMQGNAHRSQPIRATIPPVLLMLRYCSRTSTQKLIVHDYLQPTNFYWWTIKGRRGGLPAVLPRFVASKKHTEK